MVARIWDLLVDGEISRRVGIFKYLWSYLTTSRTPEADVCSRMGFARTGIQSLNYLKNVLFFIYFVT